MRDLEDLAPWLRLKLMSLFSKVLGEKSDLNCSLNFVLTFDKRFWLFICGEL